MRDRIIVALDTPDAASALALVDRLGAACTFYKVGLELYTAAGPAVVASLRDRGRNVFLDLKLHDIPNTVAGATARAAELGVRFLTVHAMGGAAMLAASVAAPPDGSRMPACVYRVSADISSPSARALRTKLLGLRRPRSIWLRYGFDSRAILASCRWLSSISSRWARMKSPSWSKPGNGFADR